MSDEPAGADGHVELDALKTGDRVQLSDTKGKLHTVTLQEGKSFHTHKGAIAHDDLIGQPEGVVVMSTGGVAVPGVPSAAGRLRAVDAPRSGGGLPKGRGADRGIRRRLPRGSRARGRCRLRRADVFAAPCGGYAGTVHSYERRADFAEVAEANVETFFGERPDSWELTVGDLVEVTDPETVDRVVLDMLSPWECIPGREGAAPRWRPLRLCGHDHPAVHDRGGPARPRWLHRAGVQRDDGAHLARRGPGGASGPPDDRPHRIPGHEQASGPRRDRPPPTPSTGEGSWGLGASTAGRYGQ